MMDNTRDATDGARPATPEIGVVVARYREDLAWLRELGLPATVYNKGPELDASALPPGVRVQALPNTGREAHTFLTHIIANYAALPACTVFLQGDPFAHLAPPQEARPSPLALRQRLLELAASGPALLPGWPGSACAATGLGQPHDLGDPAKEGRWKGWGKKLPVGGCTRRSLTPGPRGSSSPVRPRATC